MKTILIYGPGCAKCTELAERTRQAAQELGLNASLEKVTDPMQFAVAGVLVTPALAVDGKVLISGEVPSVKELKKLLSAEKEREVSEGCCCSAGNQPEAKPASGCCDGGCGCGSSDGAGWKKAIVWVAAILILLAAIKLVNRNNRNSSEPNSAVPAIKAEESE